MELIYKFELLENHGYTADTDEIIIEYLNKGALVIDVRTPFEFAQGHIPNSELIQMHEIPAQVERLVNLGESIILVCHSGYRANIAKNYLLSFGIDVINAGNWQSIERLS